MTKKEFTRITSNYDSHRPLLWEALEATSGIVIELGCGWGSTPFLTEYCRDNNRVLESFENNDQWLLKLVDSFPHIHKITNWDFVLKDCSLVFIDHAPGERRKIDIARFANHAQIIVAHDTEPAADHGYKMRAELARFKYMIDYETDGAWATAVSNFIDVTQWAKNLQP